MDKFQFNPISILDSFFGMYDKLIVSLPPTAQFVLSLVILLAIVGTIFGLIKHGHWIFIVLFVILVPGGWTALRTVAAFIYIMLKALLIRMQINI